MICDCGFSAEACAKNPCMRKKVHLSGLTPDSKWPHTGRHAEGVSGKEELARDIVQYVMANDIITQHGMKGLRERLAAAIPDDVGVFYDAMLKRVAALMPAQSGTRDGLALDILASGIEAYEAKTDRQSPAERDDRECSISVDNPNFCSAGNCRRCRDWRDGFDAASRSQPGTVKIDMSAELMDAAAEIRRLSDLDIMHEAAQKLLAAERDVLLDQVEELKTCLHDFVFKEAVSDKTIVRAKRLVSEGGGK